MFHVVQRVVTEGAEHGIAMRFFERGNVGFAHGEAFEHQHVAEHRICGDVGRKVILRAGQCCSVQHERRIVDAHTCRLEVAAQSLGVPDFLLEVGSEPATIPAVRHVHVRRAEDALGRDDHVIDEHEVVGDDGPFRGVDSHEVRTDFDFQLSRETCHGVTGAHDYLSLESAAGSVSVCRSP